MKRTRYLLLPQRQQIWKTPDGPRHADPAGSRWEQVADNMPHMRIAYTEDGKRIAVPTDRISKERAAAD